MPKTISRRSSRSAGIKLAFEPISAWEALPAAEQPKVQAYAEDLKHFLHRGKTERECVAAIERTLRRQGFHPLEAKPEVRPGDRIFKSIKGRALVAAVVGDARRPWRLVGAHVDSPRLDLKPMPLYEDLSVTLLQTHYYGGIKKFQWMNTPLSLHALVHTRSGPQAFTIGEAAGEPRFLIPDLPVHLAREQLDKPAKQAVEGEHMRVVCGHRPAPRAKAGEKVKTAVLELLHKKYGLVERDLFSADISLVPAAAPVDVGLDAALIAAYGLDDRVCVFAALQALAGTTQAKGVALGVFVDKEEIGSDGDTGAQSRLLENFAAELLAKLGQPVTAAQALERAAAISADVTEAANPNFREASDIRNSSRLGGGVTLEKFGGSGGKYGTNDASSEYMSWLVGLLEANRIPWQTGELGRLGLGGGGTIAKYFSRYGMDAIDAGPPLLSMHSPQELVSKVDAYCAYRAYEVFLRS